jgi:hypothetical protein
MNKKNKYILIDLYNGSSEILPFEEAKEAVLGLKKKKGDLTLWKGEEYMVVEIVPEVIEKVVYDEWEYSG